MSPLLVAIARIFNPLALSLAGTRLLPLYGALEHHGRRSGKKYTTPVVMTRTDDGFVIPLPWGDGTDWCRNVRAAGGCVVRWNGARYETTAPEVVDGADAGAAFGGVQASLMRRLGIDHCLRLRDVT